MCNSTWKKFSGSTKRLGDRSVLQKFKVISRFLREFHYQQKIGQKENLNSPGALKNTGPKHPALGSQRVEARPK